MEIKDITLCGVSGALLVVIQIALGFIPNVELVSLLLIIFSLVYGVRVFYIIGVFVFLEGVLYGFGMWWLNYLYVWTVLALVTLIFRREKSPVFWALVSGFYGLSFGALCSVPYFFIGWVGGTVESGLNMALAYWLTGITFDLIHGVANFLVAMVLFKPLYSLLRGVTKRS